MKKGSKISLIILVILLIVFIALIPVGFALFSHSRNESTETKIGVIKIDLIEDWPDTPDTGILNNIKKVWGVSTGDIPAYVRVRCIPIVQYKVTEDETEKWLTAPVSQDNVAINVTDVTEEGEQPSTVQKWIKKGDYWYYYKIVKPSEATDKMQIKWDVVSIPSEISTYPIRANVKVLLEYSQTTNDAWKTNFQITELPSGVEVVE